MATGTTQANGHPRNVAGRRKMQVWVLLGALAVLALTTTACSAASQSAPTSSAPAQSQSTAPAATTLAATETAPAPAPATPPAPKLKITNPVVGKGATAKAGDLVTVDYTGWLEDGTKFDSSLDRDTPFKFTLGAGQVIEGWDKGVVGMKVGGTRVLIIPPEMGYGSQGAGDAIPPNATLKFQIKLLGVQPAGK